jgi:hypothetical protein
MGPRVTPALTPASTGGSSHDAGDAPINPKAGLPNATPYTGVLSLPGADIQTVARDAFQCWGNLSNDALSERTRAL